MSAYKNSLNTHNYKHKNTANHNQRRNFLTGLLTGGLAVGAVVVLLLSIGTAGQNLYRYSTQPGSYEHPLAGESLAADTDVESIVPDGQSRLYALTTGGLLVLDRNRSTWRKISTIPDLAVSLAVDPADPNNLYAGTSAYGAYHSVDGGQTWTMINRGLGWQPGRLIRVSAIAIDRNDPRHLSLATAYQVGNRLSGEGVYQSVDAGQSWQKLAGTKAVVYKTGIVNGQVYAVSSAGLINYNNSVVAPNNSFAVQLQHWVNPNGTQLLILLFIVVIGGALLLGPSPVFHLHKPIPPHSRKPGVLKPHGH